LKKIHFLIAMLLICLTLVSCNSDKAVEKELLSTDYIKMIKNQTFFLSATSYKYLGSGTYRKNHIEINNDGKKIEYSELLYGDKEIGDPDVLVITKISDDYTFETYHPASKTYQLFKYAIEDSMDEETRAAIEAAGGYTGPFDDTIILTTEKIDFTYTQSGNTTISYLAENENNNTEYYYEEYTYTVNNKWYGGYNESYTYPEGFESTATFYFDEDNNLAAIQDETYLFIVDQFTEDAPDDFTFVDKNDYTLVDDLSEFTGL